MDGPSKGDDNLSTWSVLLVQNCVVLCMVMSKPHLDRAKDFSRVGRDCVFQASFQCFEILNSGAGVAGWRAGRSCSGVGKNGTAAEAAWQCAQ